jgi:hypothetical protein
VDAHRLSPLAIASRELVIRFCAGAAPEVVEVGCRELLLTNTSGLELSDSRVGEVAYEIIRGIVSGAAAVRDSAIAAATRGVCDPGGPGDTARLRISEQACLAVRDSEHATASDYRSALRGAATAARISADELHDRISGTPAVTRRPFQSGGGPRVATHSRHGNS